MLPFNYPCEISWHQHVFGCPRPGQLSASCLLPGWRVVTRCDESWQCSWHRVTCHGRHVTTVTLSPRWLSGPIWPGYQAPCLIECDTQGPDVTTGITPHRMSDTLITQLVHLNHPESGIKPGHSELGWTWLSLLLLNWIELFYHRNYFYEFWLGFDPLITIEPWLKLC